MTKKKFKWKWISGFSIMLYSSVEITETQCGNFETLLPPRRFATKIPWNQRFQVRNLTISWFDGKYFAWQRISVISAQWKFTLTHLWEKIRESNGFTKQIRSVEKSSKTRSPFSQEIQRFSVKSTFLLKKFLYHSV